MTSIPLARLQVLAAALLFSTGGAGIKAAAFTGPQVSALRSGIAAIVLLTVLRHRARWSWSTAGIGVVYAATLTLFVSATKLTTAANAIFLQSTAPLYVLFLSPLLLKEHFKTKDLGYVAALAVGMVLCFAGQPAATATAPDPATGNLLALASGVTWALTLLALRALGRSGDGTAPALTAVIAGNAIACAVALPSALPLPNAAAGEWVTVVYLGLCQIGLAYVCLTSAMTRLPALEVSLLLLLEPVLNPVWTWLIRGERAGTATIAGGGVIVLATALRAWRHAGDRSRRAGVVA